MNREINLSEPWKKSDVKNHKKGLTDTQKDRWLKAANDAYNSCIKNGGTDKKCAPKAIKIANSLFSNESNPENMQRLKDYLQRLSETGANYTSQSKIDHVKNHLQETINTINNNVNVSEIYKKEAIEQAKDILEAERTYTQLRAILRDALKKKHSHFEYGPFLVDFTSSEVIYEDPQDKLWKAPYQIDNNGNVTIDNPIEVYRKVTYEPINNNSNEGEGHVQTNLEESINIEGEPCNIVEANKGDNIKKVKIIGPGWGSSGYYPEETLKRDVGIYKKGTHMYWNHQTKTEEKERPEGDLNNLAGVLAEDAYYDQNGKEGPGVYAKVEVKNAYKDAVEDLAKDIGISHRAQGKAKPGEAEGKKGYIIDSLDYAKSVDFVTKPGAGGKVLEMFESANNGNYKNQNFMETNQGSNNGQNQFQESELIQENRRLKEQLMLRDAKVFVDQELEQVKNLPTVTKERLKDTLVNEAPSDKNGQLDQAKFRETISKRVKEEAEYIAKLKGQGQIKGFGEGESFNEGEQDEKKLKEAQIKEWKRLGYSDEKAKEMAGAE